MPGLKNKVTTTCIACESVCFATAAPMVVHFDGQQKLMNFVRYVCTCGNVWASKFQREHNALLFKER